VLVVADTELGGVIDGRPDGDQGSTGGIEAGDGEGTSGDRPTATARSWSVDSHTGGGDPFVVSKVRSRSALTQRISPWEAPSASTGRMPTRAFCGKVRESGEPMNATSEPSGDTDGDP